MGPFGSFIQFLAGSRWNSGRIGSAASFDSDTTGSSFRTRADMSCVTIDEAATVAAEDKKARRVIGFLDFLFIRDTQP
jgi:hypothetical protein